MIEYHSPNAKMQENDFRGWIVLLAILYKMYRIFIMIFAGKMENSS